MKTGVTTPSRRITADVDSRTPSDAAWRSVSSSSSKTPLEKLTEDELQSWLASVNLSNVMTKLTEHSVTGEVLAICDEVDELQELGISKLHAKLLFKRIADVKANGSYVEIPSPSITGQFFP